MTINLIAFLAGVIVTLIYIHASKPQKP